MSVMGIHVDVIMEHAMSDVYDRLWKYHTDGYCTTQDIYEALTAGWGDGVADGWLEWVEQGEEYE